MFCYLVVPWVDWSRVSGTHWVFYVTASIDVPGVYETREKGHGVT